MNIRMRTIKYIISTLLVFLSFVNVNAETYYTSHYFEVNVDGKSIDDDFYVTFLQCTADLEMISRATNHEFEDLSKDVSIRYSAKLDSSAYYNYHKEFYHTTNGKLSIITSRIWSDYYSVVVYYPNRNIVCVSQSRNVKMHNYEDVIVKDNDKNPIFFSAFPRKLQSDAFWGIAICLIIMFLSSRVLKLFDFTPDRLSMGIVFILCFAYWSLLRCTMIYEPLFVVIIFSLVYLLLPPLLLFFSHMYLKIEGKRCIGKLIGYTLTMSVIIDVCINLCCFLCTYA